MRWPNIRKLNLAYCRLGDVSALADSDTLEHLTLADNYANDGLLVSTLTAKLPSLNWINFYRSIKTSDLSFLANYPSLETLWLHDNYRLDFSTMPKNLPSLKELNLGRCGVPSPANWLKNYS